LNLLRVKDRLAGKRPVSVPDANMGVKEEEEENRSLGPHRAPLRVLSRRRQIVTVVAWPTFADQVFGAYPPSCLGGEPTQVATITAAAFAPASNVTFT